MKVFIVVITIAVVLLATSCLSSGSGGTTELESRVAQLESENHSLQAELSVCQTDFDSLEETKEQLDEDYQNVWTQMEELGNQLDGLQDNYDLLTDNHDSLIIDYQTLQTQNQELTNQRDSLLADYDSLQTQNQEVTDQRDALQTGYDSLVGDYDSLQTQKDDLQAEYDSLVDWYDEIRNEVNLRGGNWMDKMSFVTPNDVTVSAKVEEVTGGFSSDVNEQWADIWKMYDWVVDNIEYNWDSQLPYLPYMGGTLSWYHDYWRMPSETLEDGVGDCEDMATLLASMFLNYFSSAGYSCWCVTWHSDESGHAAVAFPVEGGELTILDPAGNYYTHDSWGGLTSKDVSVAVDEWLAHWQPKPGIYVSGVFSVTVYETFLTTDSFVEWALAN